MSETKIKLTLINGKVYCFKAEDYFKIRYDHRVIGNLVGPSSGFPGDLNQKGLPAIFLDVEAKLLVEKGFAEIVSKPSLLQRPTEEDVAAFKSYQEVRMEELKVAETERSLNQFKVNLPKIMKGLEKKGKKVTADELIAEQEKKLDATPLTNCLIQVPTADYLSTPHVPVAFEPLSFRYRVFRDFWEKGYTVTAGETFGGDFLAYPGDPLHYHASHIIICREDYEQLAANDLVRYGRSSVIVNKKCVFVFSVAGELKFQTLEWVNPTKSDNKNLFLDFR